MCILYVDTVLIPRDIILLILFTLENFIAEQDKSFGKRSIFLFTFGRDGSKLAKLQQLLLFHPRGH